MQFHRCWLQVSAVLLFYFILFHFASASCCLQFAVAVWLVSKRQQLPSMQRTLADRRLASELREGAALFISILDLAC